MKKSKAETAETRQRIVECAAREFRRNGIHATGLNDVMAAAGLTRGGFYRHFQSKDQLVAEACAAGLQSFIAKAEAASHLSDGENELEALIESYLAINRRDGRSGGCLLAGLGSELARADEGTRAAISVELLKLVDLLAGHSRRRKPEQAKSEALFALSAMVGAVTLSRIVTDPDLSRAILSDAQKRLARA